MKEKIKVNSKQDLAKRIYELNCEIEGLEAFRSELRERLAARMKVDEVVPFKTRSGMYRAKLIPSQVRHLKDNRDIFRKIGTTGFLAVSRVQTGLLEEWINEHLRFPARQMNACTRLIEDKPVLRILRGEE